MINAFETMVETYGSDVVTAYAKTHLGLKKTLSEDHLAKLKAGREKALAQKKAASAATSVASSGAGSVAESEAEGEAAPAEKPRKVRAPMSDEKKAEMAAKRKATIEAKKAAEPVAAAPAPVAAAAEPVAAAAEAGKKTRTLSAEHLAKLKAGREKAYAAKKAAAAPAAAPAPAAAAPAPAPEPAAPAPVDATEEERKAVFAYLFKLQRGGTINMIECDRAMMRKFGFDNKKAGEYQDEYMEDYLALKEKYDTQ